jgi:hypothetical protein
VVAQKRLLEYAAPASTPLFKARRTGDANDRIIIDSDGKLRLGDGTAAPAVANFMHVVVHGADANVARPVGALSVFWIGSVYPANQDTATDMWLDTDAEPTGAEFDFADYITDAIVNGVIDKAPTQNAVFDALANKLDQYDGPDTDVYWNGYLIDDLADAEVDGTAQAVNMKTLWRSNDRNSVKAATTAALGWTTGVTYTTLQGPGSIATIDGVALGVNDLLLVKNEAGRYNGVYYIADNGAVSGNWTIHRAPAFQTGDRLSHRIVHVSGGTVNKDRVFVFPKMTGSNVDAADTVPRPLAYETTDNKIEIRDSAGVVKGYLRGDGNSVSMWAPASVADPNASPYAPQIDLDGTTGNVYLGTPGAAWMQLDNTDDTIWIFGKSDANIRVGDIGGIGGAYDGVELRANQTGTTPKLYVDPQGVTLHAGSGGRVGSTAPDSTTADDDQVVVAFWFRDRMLNDYITGAIANGVVDKAPTQDAVFDALALKANLASPALSGSPTAPTQSAGDNSTKIATTAYADAKVAGAITNGVTGIAPSQDAVFDALVLKADLASPPFTGTPTAPTAAQGTNTTQLATTAMVQSEVVLLAPKASPALTGSPTAPTQAAGDNSTKLGTTAYVDAKVTNAIADGELDKAPTQNAVFDALALKADLASPALTGSPTAPTQAAGDDSTKIATTAYVDSWRQPIFSLGAAVAYTLDVVDAGCLLTMTTTGAVTITVPQDSVSAVPIGSIIDLMPLGVGGQITVVAGTGATLRVSGLTAKSRAQYSRIAVQKIAANTWSLYGDLAAT